MGLTKQKKGVSIIIGYVLLIVFAIIISAGVYTWLKTYVPSQSLSCPDSASIFVKEASFNSSLHQLTVKVRNNGRFDVAGYFIYASNNSNQSTPTLELSPYLNENEAGMIFGSSVILSETGGNSLGPGEERINVFTIPTEIGDIYSIRIIPTRFQQEDNKERFVSCAEANVQQIVGEPTVCSPDCSGRVCGGDGCGGSCGTCSSEFFCDGVGQCISSQCTPASNATLGGVCGAFVCGTKTNGTCGQVECGTCSGGFTCNATIGQCVSDCGNGITDANETCDDGNVNSSDGCSSTCQVESGYSCTGTPSTCTLLCGNGAINAGEGCDDGDGTSGDGCSSTCQVESGYSCAGQPSVCTSGGGSFNSCGDYCDSFPGYNNVNSCVQNPSQCGGANKVYIGDVSGANATYGNSFCNIGNADTCCCTPN